MAIPPLPALCLSGEWQNSSMPDRPTGLIALPYYIFAASRSRKDCNTADAKWKALMSENLREYKSAGRRKIQRGRDAGLSGCSPGIIWRGVKISYSSVERIENTVKRQTLNWKSGSHVPELCLRLEASGTTRRRRDGKLGLIGSESVEI